ncbi:MAG: DUF4381 domain-containing protein [Methylococcales bacterium]|nr:DUF4381 domain-containing protein [Methylococcales bacterium]
MKDLRDIHLPESINLLSFAVGWWFLLLFIVILLCFCVWIYKKITKKTILKTAKNNLFTLKQNKSLSSHEKIKQLSTLIRHVTISFHSRTKSASLTGKAWLNYLDSFGNKKRFNSSLGQCLIIAPYQKELPSEGEIDQLILLTEEWLKGQA